MKGVEVDDDLRPAALKGRADAARALLHAPFEEQAARTPEATALIDGDLRWTYAELNRRAEALARHLVALGVRPDDRVGVCHDRSAGVLAALLGVLKAGGAYVPLDPAYPRERLGYTLEDSGAVALVTQEKLLGILPETTAEIVLVDGSEDAAGRAADLEPAAPVASAVDPGNLAYVIYTSGSTGRPKGVAVEHRSVAAFISWAQTVFSPAELAGVFASTSISFDISVVELYLPLACGGTVILGENALALPGLPAASEVTLINTVPSAMSELIRLGALPPSARTVNLGGEALRRTLAERVYASGTVERLFNLYGPTEDTVYSTFLRVPREPGPGEPTIGVAIDGTWTRLADPWFEAVPPGEVGELLLGGAGLARGYLGRPDLTAERFVPDPSSPEPGGRLYRTGDLARLRSDGELDYLGRIDHQVKIRGFRIELGEVESALQARPGVREAVVVAREDTPGDKRLAAYLVVSGDESPAERRAALREALRERLPEHMVPSAFVFLEELPLTPNGKVDRKALPAPDLGTDIREVVPPRNPTEALLAGTWGKVLGWTGAVGVHDDFFDLGGHSLLAGRVVSQVRDALGIEITVRDLFEAPTPAALAERLEALRREENRDSAARLAPPIRPVRPIPGGRPLPLSHSQERLWLIERLSPGTSAYNVPTAIELRGTLDVAAWTATLSEIVRRHEILRTVYRPELDGAVQVIQPAAPVPVPLIDLAGLPEEIAGPEGLRLAEADARRPFDLEHGPVLRTALLRLAGERWLALVHIHHIATDGWSADVLAAEIQGLYSEVAAGRPSPLPELAVQYADYAVWQRAWLEGDGAAAIAGQLDYWRKRLAGDTPLELPADRPRPAVFRYRGATLPLSLPAARVRPLRALARRSGGTLFMALAAGFQTLLARLSGQEMVSIGTPVAGRTRSEIEPLIGFFLNTVVLRTGLQGNPSFAEAVGRVRETALGAHANADVPFDRVVAELRPERGAGSSPLFQVLFVLDTTPFEALGLPGLETSEIRPERGAAVFDLTMSLAERDEGVVGWLEYSSDLFDGATAERLAGFYAALLGGAALAPGTRLSDLPLLSPDERRQLVTDWSGAALPLPPRPETHHEWIERQVDRTPDAVALIFGEVELTYREMDERANRLAHRLIALGAGPEVRIGLYVDRSVEMAIAFLAVLKAGAAYVALDPFYPRERIAMIVEDSRLHLLLVQSALRCDAPLAGVEVPVLEIEALEAEAAALVPQQNHRPDTGVSADNLLYVVFTSGSTGRPKGIAMTHAGMLNALAWQLVSSRDLPSTAATLQFSSLNFDISFQEMISTWWTGGRMVLIPGEQRLDPGAVLDLVLRHSIERLYLPPVFLQQLAQTVVDRGVTRLPVLEVYAAGEQLQVTPAVRAFFATMPPQAALHNQFGPSETHLTTQLSLPVSELQSWPALPAIGTVLPGVHVYLLDRAAQLVPVGVTGEVYIGGHGHARGYIGRPDLTADRFLPDPFSGLPGARLYKTGDLARYRTTGVLDFLGRSDSQVKIRGYRIEPLEVETVLAAHPEVEECAVVPRRLTGGELRLVAWVVPASPEAAADPEGLKNRLLEDLATKLPEVMVPARFVMAESLPQTPTGKLDRRSLAKVELPDEENAGSAEDGAPRTPTEELLTGLWARVLRQERVRVHDNFFELGGHSLIAAQIAARVRDTFGVDLPARAVFENPTPAALAGRIEAARGARAARVEIPPIVPVERDRPLPVSFSQERLWFLEQVQPGGVNDVPLALRIEGPLDAAAWLASLAEVRKRHEALRTTFEVTLDGLVQRVAPAEEPWVQPVIDLGVLPPGHGEAERSRIASAEARWPFDLAAGPLFRSLLVRLGAEEHAAFLTFHHTVFDGWSVEVLLSELERLYPALTEGRPSPLPELALQYPDFAVWQRDWMEGPGRPLIEAEIEYWRRQLAGSEEDTAVELPTDRPRPAQQRFEGGDVEVEIPAEAGRALRALGHEIGATMFMGLIAALESLLIRLSGRGKASVGTAIAGRNRVETEGLIGCFINSLVLRTDLSGDPAFTDALRRVREVTLEAYAHQEVPFARLIQELQPERSTSATPFFQIVLIHVNTPPERLSLPGLRVIDQRAEHGVARLDLAFWLWEREDGGVTGWVEYSDDLFDRTTVERLAGTLRNLLVEGAAVPGSRLSELPLLSAAERHQILEVWSGPPALPAANPDLGTIHAAVAAQAARTPDAVAVTCGGESLTHGELDRRSNRLARHLRALGVGPEARVGVYLERQLDLIVALLGVLKAGGAYVPLDPAHPRERLAGIVADSRAAVLLTQAALRDGVPADAGTVRILDLDEDRVALAALPDGPLGPDTDPDALAYILYTSGSTGRPKGVAIAHRTVVGFLRAIREVTGFGPADVTLALATMSFDISVLEVFLPLTAGGRTELVGRQEATDAVLLAERIAAAGVTLLQATPATWRLLAQSGWTAPRPTQGLCGGEPLPRDLADRVIDSLGPAGRLWNVYGPTETTVWSSAGEVRRGEPIAVGPSVPGVRHYLLDRWLQPVPAGAPAEVFIGGPGVGRGYWDRPALTAEVYLPDPFARAAGARFYRTGDLGRWLPDGRIDLLGRADFQVKVRGFRIELGEIEGVLGEHPRIRERAVIAQKAGNDTRLLAFLVSDGGPLPAAELREFLRRRLPDYMVPAAYFQLDRLPLNVNGKVDRKALLALEAAAPAETGRTQGPEAPRTFVEELLTRSWSEVLGRERVGVRDDFFELGGHSLLAAQIVARIQAAFGVRLPMRAIFEAPTPAGLAEAVERALRARSGAAGTLPPIVRARRDGRALPLSFAQEQLWFLSQIQPGAVYNLPYALRLEGRLDVKAWQGALTEIRRRHEALRTTFPARPEGGARQRVAPDTEPWLQPVVDLSGLPEDIRDGEAARLADAEAGRPFDLAAGPLLRTALLRLDPDEHRALLTVHHIVADGWSTGLLLGELERLYGTLAAGRRTADAGLPALPVQYADYAAWQRDWMREEALAAPLAYWRHQLAGAPDLELPADRPRPAVHTFRGGIVNFAVPAAQTARLSDLARNTGGTLFMVLTAVLQAVLHRLSGSLDFTVGTAVANRGRTEIENLIGFFANVLVLRADLAGDPTFVELLERVRETALAAYSHQDVPFEKLVEELRPERRLDQNPLFQVAFTFQHIGMPEFADTGLRVVDGSPHSGTSKFDLSLFIGEDEDGLHGLWEYSSDLFDRATIERLAGHGLRLLEEVAADPGRRVSTLEILSSEERRQLFSEWNPQVPVALPWPSLHAGFAARAARTPEAVAVSGEEGSLTYRELDEKADRLAARLRAEGVGPDVLVGLCAERSLDLIIGLLGILKAGGAYVPLDPSYPQERLGFIADDTAAPVIVVQEHLRGQLPATRARLVGIGDTGEGAPVLRAGQEAGPENAAYVIYTSGSTGQPKGVVVTHGNALRLFAATEPWFAFGPDATWTLFHSYAFDFSVWEIWGALLYGGRLVVVPYFVSRSPEAFAGLLRRERVTVLNQTPSAFDALARAVLPSGDALPDLRTVVFGGEAISLRTLEPWLDRFDEAPRLVNMYGITETTVHVTYRPLTAADPGSGETPFGSPIGLPIPDLAVHVVDRAGQPVPVGVPGEMRVGGAGLARGYLNRPDLTAERFVPDPFSGRTGARLYRSGDLARRLPSGDLEFLGRADAQVKIRGFRIEPGEIEAALARLPEVAACAVLPRKEPQGDTTLIAYTVPQQGAVLPPARTLREALMASLPDYMVPARFAEIPALPLTPSGKIDRRALSQLTLGGGFAAAEGHSAPRTPTEEALAGFWLEVLGADRTGGRIGVHDDFFARGGHSLLATRLINRIRGTFGIDLPLRALFEAPTPARLAEKVDAALLAAAGSISARSAPQIVPVGRDRELPLSFAQERLWFLDQLQPGNHYNVPLALRLTGPLDVAAWESAVQEIRRRHEALRTHFVGGSGSVSQVVDPPRPWPLPVIDLAGLPTTGREREARRLAQTESERCFDLATGPLARASLYHLGDRDHVSLMTFHHIVSDGWSMGVLMSELEALYSAFATGRPSPLPELPVQYADFAAWQRRWLSGETLDAQLDYWRQRLRGEPFLTLPADRPAPPAQSFRGASFAQRLPADLAADLADLGRRSGATLFMVLLAAFDTLIHRYTGSLDLVVGSPISGRNRPEIEGLIGFFVNTLVLRSDLSGDPTFAALLGQVRETALGAYAHQDLPFEKLVEELRPERRLDQNPIFQVVLSFQRLAPLSTWQGVGVAPFELTSWSAKFDLDLAVVEEESGLACWWEYKTDLYDEATIARTAGHWARLLAAIASEPGRRISELPLLTPEEGEQLLREWNPQVPVTLPWPSLHAGFAAQVTRTPGAVAVSSEEGSLTYRDLDEKTDHLAGRLRAEGVGPDVLVGLCAERSLDLIVGLLGILKAGGAYVPLDPAYPQERLAFIAEDTAVTVIVVQGHLRDRLPATGARLVGIGETGEGAAAPALEAGRQAGPENAAYVIYTSGSTGRPKGVVVTHANALRLFAATEPWFAFGPDDTWTLFHSYAFDFSVWEIWGALLYGGRLVVVPYFVSRSPEAFAGLLRREQVTVLNQTPSAFDALSRAVLPSGEALPDLRTVVFGGEAISLRALEPWLGRFTEAPRLVNMYGITETTVHVTYRPLSAADPGSGETPFGSPIGVPIPDLAVHVVDRAGQLVPVGVPGEMRVGGAGLARGYLNRPDLTAERFVPDPFSGKTGARLYHSGDLARRLPSGELEFLGRADAQVKIRGFRIEPGEIEAALACLPEVAACAVLPRREPQGDTVLAAYLVLKPGAAMPSPRTLREALLASLPDYMAPGIFAEIPELPTTPSGKVDRGALARLDLTATSGVSVLPSAAPRTPAEEVLTGLFLEALGEERTGGRVGINDDFFERGGHSLLATQVVNRIRTAFGIDLPLRALFEAATPAGLAVRVEAALLEAAGSPTARSAPPIMPVGRDRDLPLSFAQERLWFLDQMQPGGLYNIPLALRLEGDLDPVAWRRSLDAICRRHEPLRTRFRTNGGALVQVIDPPSAIPQPLIDLSFLPEAARKREARRLAQDEAGRPFDLAAGPVARASLVRLGAADHLALLTFHHIAADGWSLGVLLTELEGLYTGAAALSDLPVQYADFAVWQRQWLSGAVLDAQLDYWRRQLAGDPFLALPADRPMPAAQTFRGAAWSQTLPAELAADLHNLGRRTGTTLFMVLLSAYAALLHRHSGNLEIAVGSPIAGRNRPEVEGLIGFFVNTLVLRSNLADDPAFDLLLGRTRETALGAYSHQDLPFEKLVEELRPELRLDQNPLFQVVLSLERPTLNEDWAGFRLRPFGLASRSAKFDLNLAVVEEDGSLTCAWEYKTDLFDEATVARLAGHWATLLADAAAYPGRAVSRLALLTPAEHHQVAAEWNDTASAFPREVTLPERFERQARLRPEAVALVAGEAVLTYRELDERGERLASRLRGLGVGPESRVALALPRSFDLVAAILGILKAGGAYVPLDPDYPAERLAFMLSDSRAQAVVTRPDLAGRLPVGGLPVIEVGSGDESDWTAGEGLRPASDNLAYVMYTSGSTGTPKGVAVTHRNVIRLVEETGYAEMGPDQTFLQFAPVSFDASTLEVWAPILHGGRLVLAPEGRASLAELGAVIQGGGVTAMWLTAGLFHQMVDEEIEGLAGLRQLLAGGDVVSPPHARKVLERFPGLTLINGYGPTEGTTFSACHPMRSPAEVNSPVPIGRPIANARLHVLDSRLERVPAGVPGELYIGGDGLARGYLDRPALTAERFVPAPCGPWGERLYRTGDLVRWLPSGRLEFLGRVDLQVKVSGHRVELGEIEALLARHSAVGQSAVVVHDDPRAGRRLVAYVAPPPGVARPSSSELRSWLKERLPEPMMPALFVLLDRLPLNPNGKVDRRALPAPGESGIETTETATAAPRTPTEELLVTLWAEALGIDQPGRIGLHDDFFELGGHSLLATRLVARIRQVFRVDLSLRALFEAPTVAELARALSRQLAEETGPPPPDIVALPREGDEPSFPASLAQRRLWILHQVAPAGFFLNVTHALRFRGALDPEALRRGLAEITHRHESLRTTFANRDGQPVQRISPPAPLTLPWIDLSALPVERREAEASRIAQDEAARPFDLVRGPLARFALLRLTAGEHVLILTPHHLVFDGRSMEILFHELAVLYEAHLTGRPAPLPTLPVQYADFAVWQRQAMAGPALETQLRYWKGQLAGVPPLELPLDRPRPATGSFRGDWHSFDLAPGLLKRLAGLCRRQGVTQFMALMAAVELFLARVTNQSDFPVGTPIANRSRPEVEGLIGFFVNTLVLRADLSGAPSFLTLLERVRESALGAYTHQELPFESLVEELQPERQLTANPIFGVLFNMLDAPQPVDFPGVRVDAFEFNLDLAHFDLMVTAMRGSRDDAGTLTLVLNHSRDLFDRTTAQRMLDLLVRLLEGAVDEPERPAWDLPVFDAMAWHQVVREWNDTAGELPAPVTTEQLIERWGREIPDALAVSAPSVQLTYAGLNDQANRLAHRLQRLGIGPEVTVALGFERSAELIISALAVWKAGGAFLPLDLSAPADRLALVVEDAGAPLVITAQATAERFAGCQARVISFEVEAASLDQESAAEPHRASLAQNRAYVIYTSGSTGRPKGVEVQHSSLFNLICWQQQRFAITPESRVNLAAIPAFDASIYEMWPYLTAGASVHVPPAEITPSAREMLRWIARERITHGYLTTPQADRALAGERPEGLTDLRWILAGGDRLHQRPFRTDSFDLINIYGPTEATVVTTYRQVTRMEDAPPRLPTIGGPLLNVAVHLLDHQLRPVPIGSLGELFIAGTGLARGYLGRPALTAERYVPHPFAEEPGARLYKTGDLVRYLPNGRLDFVGRSDHQVKIRGFRIELGEIEAVLATHPDVAEAVVIVRTEATGPRLVAYAVPRDRASFPEVSTLRESLRAKLPEYMVPSAFVVLDALPLTSRDKVDRNALPPPPAPGSTDGGDGSASHAPLRSGTEERIADVWREVLRIELVGGEDNFFDLGGHSLAMVAIHERLQSELGREFPLVEMFENPTIRSLALALDRFQAGVTAVVEPAAERQDVQQRAEKQRHAQAWKDRARQARRTPR